MNWMSPAMVLLAGWLAVFAQTQMVWARVVLGAPVSVVPALLVYGSFTHGLGLVTALSAVVGLGADALSGSRVGLGMVMPFAAGFLLNTRRHLLLRDQRYAQFWLGLGAGVALPLGHALALHAAHAEPALGWHSIRSLLALGLLNGVACPACFLLFDRLRGALEYPVEPTSFQAGAREMKRGRT